MKYLEANKYLIRYYFIYKYKSYRKAAHNFYIQTTDRNMKNAVEQLEQFYNAQFIILKGNRLAFTEAGHILGKMSEKIFNLNLETYSLLQRLNCKEIRFATSPDFYKYYVKPIIMNFRKEEPDVRIVFFKTNQLDAVSKLLNRDIDFFIGSIPTVPHPDFQYKKLYDAQILLVVKKSNTSLIQNIKKLDALGRFKGAMNDSTDPVYFHIRDGLNNLQVTLNFIFYTSDYDSLIESVINSNVDYALVGNYYFYPELEYYDISHLFSPLCIALIFRKHEEPTLAIKKIIKTGEKMDIKLNVCHNVFIKN